MVTDLKSIFWYYLNMINFNQKSYFEVQLKAVTDTSYNFLNINELVAVNYNYE